MNRLTISLTRIVRQKEGQHRPSLDDEETNREADVMGASSSNMGRSRLHYLSLLADTLRRKDQAAAVRDQDREG